jgi:hypothetical protein
MISARTRLARLSIATAIAILAAATATAEPIPTPPITPKPAGPMPVPYPDPEPPPTPECPASLCPKARATLQLAGGGSTIQIDGFSWGASANSATTVNTSDPQEGGQVTGGPIYTSDPQEGGQIARTKPKVSEIPITKVQDKSSTTLASSDPEEGGEVVAPDARKAGGGPLEASGVQTGHRENVQPLIPGYEVSSPRDAASGQATGKRMHKPVALTQGNVVVTMPERICVRGSHYPAVTLTAGDTAYEMQDVTVANCTPITTAKGKKTRAKLEYMVVKMQEALISG